MEERHLGKDCYRIQLPADLDYIPPLRQFISESARIKGFSKKFCFRTEIIIDELCTNGIIHGPRKGVGEKIDFSADFSDGTVEIEIANKTGKPEDLKRLETILNQKEPKEKEKCKGIALTRVLSNELSVDLDKEGFTRIKVLKRKDVNILKMVSN